MIDRSDITAIGAFRKTHALGGELNAEFEIDPEDLAPETALIVDIDGIFVPFFADGIRRKGASTRLIHLHGVDSVDDAKPFVNKTIYILKEDMPDDFEDADGQYADDLVGYTILDLDQRPIGVIKDLDTSTENTLFIVDLSPDGSRTAFVPVTDEWISNIDDVEKTISMDLPEGLIDLN